MFGMTTEKPVTLNLFQGLVPTCRRCPTKFGMTSTAKSIRFSADFITCIPH